jgi:preprotein translocase subunit YajC
MWVLFIMPQRRRQSAQRHMLEDLELGDEIVTVGGLIGHVRAIDDEEILLEVAPGTNLRLARRAVAAVVPPEEPDEEPDDEPLADERAPESDPIQANPR